MASRRVGIGANGVKGDITQVEKPGEADDDIQTPSEHHIDQDLDAEIVDPFDGAAKARGRK